MPHVIKFTAAFFIVDMEKKPIKRGAPVTINWGMMDDAWCAGIKTIQSIADDYFKETGKKVTPAGIKKHYDGLGVPRNLINQIRAKADALVNKELVNELVKTQLKITERDVVEANAQNNATIILHERKDVSKSRNIVMKLLDELDSQIDGKEDYEKLGEILRSQDQNGADKLNDIYKRVISLPGRVDSAKKLSDSLKVLIDLERRVYKIDDNDGMVVREVKEIVLKSL